MGRWTMAVLAVVVGAGIGAGSGCTGESGRERGASAQQAAPGDPAEARARGASGGAAVSEPAAESGVVYVDVRTREEYAAGHVVGAINIPHTELEGRWRELSAHRDAPIVLYCRSGRRSSIAYDILESKGFTDLENGGGLSDLLREGLPITR